MSSNSERGTCIEHVSLIFMDEDLNNFLDEIVHQRRFVRESRDVILSNKIKCKPFASFESTETAVDLLKETLQPTVSFQKEDIEPEEEEFLEEDQS